jgi:hypothetical protein
MSEIKPAERIVLDVLRQTTLAKMSDADFANLEAEVASKGLRNVDGWLGTQMRKAVEQVLKHPGHPDQSVHGGARRKGGAPSSAPASAGGGTGGKFEAEPDDVGLGKPKSDANSRRKESEAADKVGYGANQAAENMSAHSNEMAQKIYGKDGASKRMTDIDEVELMQISDSLGSVAESLTMMSSPKMEGQYKEITRARRQLKEVRSDAMRNLSPAVRPIAVATIDKHIGEVDSLLRTHREAWTGVGGVFEKAVEPVVKHPGQHDQSVHGGGKGGGASSSSTPAPSSSGGSSAPSFKVGDKVEFTDKYGGGKTTLVRGRVVGVTSSGKLKIKPKNARQHGKTRTIDPKRVSAGHSPPDPSRSAAGRLGAKTRSDNEMPPTYTSML